MKIINITTINGRGYFPAFVYICFILFIGFTAARQGLSHYHAEDAFRTGSDFDADSGIYYQPENPGAYKVRGMIFLRNKDYQSAAEAFEKAIALRGNDFRLWLRLGYSRFKWGDTKAAETAYENGIRLAPRYSQPNHQMGKMLLETGQNQQAFSFLRKAAEYDPELYPEVLHFARITFPDDPVAIERAVQPKSVEAKKIVARYLIKRYFMTDNVKSFLVSDELGKDEKNGFISYLIYKRNFPVAYEVWQSRLKDENIGQYQPIFDGGFENITESDASGFGWQIDQRISAIAVARDDKNFHSGSSSVQIKFAGNVEINRNILSQLVYIQPHTKYQLTFFFRSTELISAGLPQIVISDGVSNEILGRFEVAQTTDSEWMEGKVNFTTKDVSVAHVSLQRPNCNTSPCSIFGELTLDDFTLSQN